MARTEATHPDIAPAADKTKVFISYSRKDREFVDRLVAALEANEHIDVFRDTEDILPTEEWKERLERLIGEADTIVFCLSPDSVASNVCSWEAEVAGRLNKRIAPVVIRDVVGNIPAALAKLNYIFFTKPEEFDRSLGYLITALDADIAWIREHTRLGELSRRWERSGRTKDQLLRGSDLAAAETWLKRPPRNAPSPTEITISYLGTSRKEVIAWARRIRAIVVGVLVLFVAAAAAWRYEQWLKEQMYWFTSVRGHVHTAKMVRALKAQQAFKDCIDCPEMIVVPAGKFIMGSPPDEKDRGDNEGPQREVAIAQPFAVSRFEATFAEWEACAEHGDCLSLVQHSGWGRGRQPVIYVSWDDVRRYVAWLPGLRASPTGYSQSPNGSTRREPVVRRPIPGATRSARATPIVTAARARGVASRLPRSAHSQPMHSACTTCTATSLSGSRIATTATTKVAPRMAPLGQPITAKSVSFAAVLGSVIQA